MIANAYIWLCLLTAFNLYGQGTEGTSQQRAKLLIGSAINWYFRWQTDLPKIESQECRVRETRQGNFSIACLPINAVFRFHPAPGGGCNLGVARHSATSPDLLPSPPPGRVLKESERGCQFFGTFTDSTMKGVEVVDGEIDPGTSEKARNAALAYLAGWSASCEAKIPYVRRNDPTFHVYLSCGGQLDTVLEFGLENGIPSSGSGWDYTKRRGFPQGVAKRLSDSKLWFSTDKVGPQDLPK